MDLLPNEILILITREFISDLRDTISFVRVCKRFNTLFSSEDFWRSLCIEKWPTLKMLTPINPVMFSWKALMKERFICEQMKIKKEEAINNSLLQASSNRKMPFDSNQYSYLYNIIRYHRDLVSDRKKLCISRLLQQFLIIEPKEADYNTIYFGKYKDLIEFILEGIFSIDDDNIHQFGTNKIRLYGLNGRKCTFSVVSWGYGLSGSLLTATIDHNHGPGNISTERELIYTRMEMMSDTELIYVLRCLGFDQSFPYQIMWIIILVVLDFYTTDYGDSEGPMLTMYRKRIEQERCAKIQSLKLS